MKKALKIVLGGFLALVLIGVLFGGDDAEKKEASVQSSQEGENTESEEAVEEVKADPVDVTTDILIDTLSNNALQASDEYSGKYVRLTGKLSTIDAQGKYFALAPMNEEFSLDSVTCNIKPEHLETVKGFSSDQTVTVIGTITDVGEVFGYTMDVETIE